MAICQSKCIVVDLDGTICPERLPDQSYADVAPNEGVAELLREYKSQGYYIIIATARTMRTHEANLGRIIASTARLTLEWLDRHAIPYDEMHFGKPWAGPEGFYVDDKAIRPDEFLRLRPDEIQELLARSKAASVKERSAPR